MSVQKIDITLLSKNAVIPTRGSEDAAGYDLYAANLEPITIQPHTTEKISTDIAVALPEGTFGAIFARSGLATKQGLRPSNAVGVIDRDYRGDIIVALYNDSEVPRIIEPHSRIAQLVVMPYVSFEFNQVDTLDSTARGDGGFGSTGD